jgi:MoxR-like ATPase
MARGKKPLSEPRYSGRGTDFYVASEQVAEIVNLAVALDRPLLVEGEPGCGKTMLAYSIASEKKLGEVLKISVKSTTRAQDLLFRVNSLRRLQDAQTPSHAQARFIYPYISLGPLGDAIHRGRRRVVLIDEVDKADIDFPNDLLDVLDRFTFEIEDLPLEEEEECRRERGFGRTISGGAADHPIVVITSNREKRLPEPFLRRCLYVRLRFPEDAAELQEIVQKNTGRGAEQIDQELVAAAIASFLAVRRTAVGNTQKPPSTGELLDWVKILWLQKTPAGKLLESPALPPHWQTLFKTMNDLDTYPSLAQRKQS